MGKKYADVLKDDQGAEYVACEREFPAALDPAQIRLVDGRPVRRPLVEAGYDAFAESYGAISKAYDIQADTVTKQWTVDLDLLKAAVCNKIDADAEARRLTIITPGAGQAQVYQRKGDQARDCLTNYDAQNPPPAGTYPALEAEVGITGADVLAVATVVKDLEDAWGTVADAIEAVRLGAKRDVEDSATTTPAQIQAILEAIVWPQPSA